MPARSRTRWLACLLFILALACVHLDAGLRFLDRHGNRVADTIRRCQAKLGENPSAADVAACFDTELGVEAPDTSAEHGEDVLRAGRAIDKAEATHDPVDEALAREQVDRVWP